MPKENGKDRVLEVGLETYSVPKLKIQVAEDSSPSSKEDPSPVKKESSKPGSPKASSSKPGSPRAGGGSPKKEVIKPDASNKSRSRGASPAKCAKGDKSPRAASPAKSAKSDKK